MLCKRIVLPTAASIIVEIRTLKTCVQPVTWKCNVLETESFLPCCEMTVGALKICLFWRTWKYVLQPMQNSLQSVIPIMLVISQQAYTKCLFWIFAPVTIYSGPKRSISKRLKGFYAWHCNDMCKCFFCLHKQLIDPLMGTSQAAHSNGPLYCTAIWWLVHWPLMSRLLHLVQRGGAWVGCGPDQSPHRCTKWNTQKQPTVHQRSVYQLHISGVTSYGALGHVPPWSLCKL